MIKKEYEKVNSPEELMEFMDKFIKYGIHGSDDNDYSTDGSPESSKAFNYACRNYYKLASPNYILTHGIGHCWDQVELERDWFTKHNYNFKTIFIWFLFDFDNNYMTHTYLIYEDKDHKGYSIFEHADYYNHGIHHFKTYKEALIWQTQRQIETNEHAGNLIDEEIIKHIHIYEYEHPKYGCNDEEFIDNIFKSNDITDLIKGEI